MENRDFSPRRSKRKCAQQRLSQEIIKSELCSQSKGSKSSNRITLRHPNKVSRTTQTSISGCINIVSNNSNASNSSRRRQRTMTKSYGSAAVVRSVTESLFQESSVYPSIEKSSGKPRNNLKKSKESHVTSSSKIVAAPHQSSSADLKQDFFCCPKCCLYFPRENYSKFRSHLSEECFVRKRAPCPYCGHLYSSQNILDYHISHMHENPHPKSKILKTKPRKEFLEFSQKVGNNGILESSAVKELEEDDWPEDEEEAEKLAALRGVWRCWICFYESQQKTLWNTHVNRIHPDAVGITFLCDICKVSFRKKYHLREHLHEVHPDQTGYTCHDCGRKFMHKNLHHLCEKIECDICNERFLSRGAKSKHMLLHPEFRPHKCQLCPKEFQKKEYLTMHMRVHDNVRPYSCEFCDKKFRSKSHYNNHKRLHTGEKPYVCHTCGKSFFSPQGLYSHMTSHVGDKAEICSTCGKTFRTPNDLKRHEYIHSGEKPHACRYCEKSFNRRSNCAVHEKSHETNEKLHCNLCGLKFAKSAKLQLHKVKKHGNAATVSNEGDTDNRVIGANDPAEIISDHLVQPVTFVQLDDVASNVEIAEVLPEESVHESVNLYQYSFQVGGSSRTVYLHTVDPT